MRALSLAALALAASAAAPAAAQMVPTSSSDAGMTRFEVQVTGKGQAPAESATVSAGVTTQNANSRVAANDNAAVMNRVFAALEAVGVARGDIATSALSVGPSDRYGNDQSTRISSFTASNQVTVTVHDLSKLSDILGALYANGANDVATPVFNVADRPALIATARREAIAAATQAARTYAEGFGMRVDHILRISERGPPSMVSSDGDIVVTYARTTPPVASPVVTANVTLWVDYALAPR